MKFVNRAKMSTATTGTGTITLGSATLGYQSFAAAGVINGDTVRYVLEEGVAWEIGTGVYDSSTSSLSRVLVESSTGNLLDLTGGAVVFLTAAGQDLLPSQGGTMTGNLVVPSINDGPLAGFRNAIINGNFDIWQRGTSVTGVANEQYLADRWIHNRVGTTANISRQTFTLGQTDVPNEPVYFHRTAVTSVAGAGNAINLTQKIESVRTFAGQTVTCSFWAKADATKNIAFNLTQFFGSGGSPSAAVVSGVTTIALTTSWQKFTVAVSVSSISGKTIGSNDNDALWVRFWFDAGSDFNSETNSLGQQSGTFDITQVQLEPGPVATPFERRPIGTELALCQRYFCLFDVVAGGAYSVAAASATAFASFYFSQPMRAAPTLTTGTLVTSSNATDNYSPFGAPTTTSGIYQVVQGALAGNFYAYRQNNAASAEL